jgi:hypothetical protein
MKARRGSTWSPISIEKRRSAAAASSIVTCCSVRVPDPSCVSRSWSGVHLAQALEALDPDALAGDRQHRAAQRSNDSASSVRR